MWSLHSRLPELSPSMLLVGRGYGLLKCVLERYRERLRCWCSPSSSGGNVAKLDELTGLIESKDQGVKDLGGFRVLLNAGRSARGR